jgi:hypothetical protein
MIHHERFLAAGPSRFPRAPSTPAGADGRLRRRKARVIKTAKKAAHFSQREELV